MCARCLCTIFITPLLNVFSRSRRFTREIVCGARQPFLLFRLFYVKRAPHQLSMSPLTPFITSGVRFRYRPLLLSFHVPRSVVSIARVRRPSSRARLVMSSILRSVYQLTLARQRGDVPRACILVVVLKRQACMFPSFSIRPFKFFSGRDVLRVFRVDQRYLINCTLRVTCKLRHVNCVRYVSEYSCAKYCNLQRFFGFESRFCIIPLMSIA